MQCERHGLAAAPDGKCVLCQREEAASARAVVKWQDRRVRLLARVVIGVVAGLAAFALLLATCDSKKPSRDDGAPASSGRQVP
jgi:hypothetical protein